MITLKRPSLLLIVPLLSLSAVPAIAAPAQQEQLDQSRAQEAERQERLGEERVETIVAPPPSVDLPADESVRFHISQITIENQVERFRFLERIARPYVDKELSLSDINKLIHAMNQSLMEPYCRTGTKSLLRGAPSRSADRLYWHRSFRRGQRYALLEESLSLPRGRYPQRTGHRAGHRTGKTSSLSGYLCSASPVQSAAEDGCRAHGKTWEEFLRYDLLG